MTNLEIEYELKLLGEAMHETLKGTNASASGIMAFVFLQDGTCHMLGRECSMEEDAISLGLKVKSHVEAFLKNQNVTEH